MSTLSGGGAGVRFWVKKERVSCEKRETWQVLCAKTQTQSLTLDAIIIDQHDNKMFSSGSSNNNNLQIIITTINYY